MEMQYNNLYTYFVFTTQDRFPCITEKHRERIEKYITGVVNNHKGKMYAIYANPEHVHFLVSRSPEMSEHELANLVADAKVCKYILNQPEHHKRKSYQDEYDAFLKFYQQTLIENKGIREEQIITFTTTKGIGNNKGLNTI